MEVSFRGGEVVEEDGAGEMGQLGLLSYVPQFLNKTYIKVTWTRDYPFYITRVPKIFFLQ